MTRAVALLATLVSAALVATGATAAGRVSITVDRTRITSGIGQKLVFRSTIANLGRGPAAGLVAHLNVLSLRAGTYVDPEDWSSQRTRYLAPILPQSSTTTTWRLEAVNSGSFGVYVAVLPASGVPESPATGPTIRVDIAERQSLDSGGILPLALGLPAALGLLSLGLRLRRRGFSFQGERRSGQLQDAGRTMRP